MSLYKWQIGNRNLLRRDRPEHREVIKTPVGSYEAFYDDLFLTEHQYLYISVNGRIYDFPTKDALKDHLGDLRGVSETAMAIGVLTTEEKCTLFTGDDQRPMMVYYHVDDLRFKKWHCIAIGFESAVAFTPNPK